MIPCGLSVHMASWKLSKGPCYFNRVKSGFWGAGVVLSHEGFRVSLLQEGKGWAGVVRLEMVRATGPLRD